MTTEERTAGGRITWIAIGGVVLFMVVAFIFASRFGTDPTLTSSPLILVERL